MEKTIIVDGQKVKLKTSAAIAIRYKQQFGSDYFADLLKLAKVLQTGTEDNSERKEELKQFNIAELKDILKNKGVVGCSKLNKGQLIKEILSMEQDGNGGLDIEKMSFENLDHLDTIVIFNFIWVMAKTADNSIPEPLTWLDGFESMPLEEILPEVTELLNASVQTRKK